MRASIRYSLARLTIFFACLLVGWMLGLHNLLWLLLAAATVSMLISLFALSGMRDAYAEEIADRVERRRERRVQRRHEEVLDDDQDAEDVEAARARRDGTI